MKSVITVQCMDGDILAEDVFSDNGVILVAKNTILNDYIKLKLIDYHIYEVKIYDSKKNKDTYLKFEKQYKEYVIQIHQLLRNVSLGNYNDIEKIIKCLTDQIYANITDGEYVVNCLSTIRNKDEYTYTHCINTAFYSSMIGNWISLTKTQICELICASLIHDIGKVKVPYEILNKKGKLTAEEYDIMKTHSVLGYKIIEDLPNLTAEIKKAVLQHHERMDGSGYPYGLKGDSINLYARIIAIADVFDAMTQNRIYKNKVSPFDSFEMFLSEGVWLFDYPILYNFLKNIAPLYVGNKVQLSNGDIGEIVYIPPQDITNPILYINSQYLDLSRNMDLKVLKVV